MFRETLKSICSQTLKPDLVAISYSCQQDVSIDVEKLFSKFFDRLHIQFLVLRQPQRLYQFEHLKMIHDHICHQYDPKNVMVTFCDDDDMLHEKRLQEVDLYRDHETVCCFFYKIDEKTTLETRRLERRPKNWSEFGCYSCRLFTFTSFLQKTWGESHEDNNYLDVYFMASTKPHVIHKHLYYHRYYHDDNMKIWNITKGHTETHTFQYLLQTIHERLEEIDWNYDVHLKQQDGVIRIVKQPDALKDYWIWLWLYRHTNLSIDEFIQYEVKG